MYANVFVSLLLMGTRRRIMVTMLFYIKIIIFRLRTV